MSYTPVVSDIPIYLHTVCLILILSSVDSRSPCVIINIGFSSAQTVLLDHLNSIPFGSESNFILGTI